MITSRWSEDPGYSFNRGGRMLLCSLYALYLVENYGLRRAVKILLVALAVSELVNVLMIVAAPSLARGEVDIRGSWRGAMGQKNSLGSAAGLGLMCAIGGLQLGAIRRVPCILLSCMSCLLLVLSNSVTAAVAIVLIGAMLFYLHTIVLPARNRVMPLLIGMLILVAVASLAAFKDQILPLFGRDSSFTGRTDVWEFAEEMIKERPFWGYGNGAWGLPMFSELVLLELKWPAPHAHNAWLDFRLQLGLPGFWLAVILWALAFMRAAGQIIKGNIRESSIFFAIFVFLSVRTYSETLIVDPAINDIFWFAFMYGGLAKLASSKKASSPGYHEPPVRYQRRLEGSLAAATRRKPSGMAH
jgi:O-antigen ligase